MENKISTVFEANADSFIKTINTLDRKLGGLQTQLVLNKKNMDSTGESTDKLARRDDLLRKKVETLKSQISALNEALKMSGINEKENVGIKDKLVEKLGQVKVKMKDAQSEIKSTAKATEDFSDAMEDGEKETDDTRKAVGALRDTLNGALNGFKGFANSISNVFKNVEDGISNLIKSATRFGKKLYSEFIQKSIDYSEELNLFNVIFENIEKNGETTFSELGLKATQFQNELNETFGTNKMETMRYQGLYQSMGESAGISKEAAYLMSENMTKLGYDLASLFNTTEKKAMESLRAGVFAGQTKPLRGYGIDVTQQTYKPILADLGIDKKVSELSQAEKEVLRYIVAIRQATKAQGDFADTIESPANQLKVLRQQIIEVGVAIGNFLVTPFQRALQVINGVIMALKALINFFAKLFGIQQKQYNAGYAYAEGYEDYSDGIDEVGESASGAAKKMKELNRQTLAFDQINNINSPTNSGSSGGGGTGGGNYGIDQRLLDAMSGYDNQMGKVEMEAVKIRNTIMEWLGFQQEFNEETHKTSFTYDTIGKTLEQILTEIGANAGAGMNFLTNSIPWATMGEELAKGLNSVFAFVHTFVSTYDWRNLGNQIGNFINKAVANTNFERLGQILTDKIRAAILTFAGLVQTINFKEIGEGLAKMINSAIENIPVRKLVTGINTLVKGIFTAIGTLMVKLDWGKIISDIVAVLAGLDWETKLVILAPILAGAIGGLLRSRFVQDVINEELTKLLKEALASLKGFSLSGTLEKLTTGFNSLAAALGLSAPALAGIVVAVTALAGAFIYAYKNNDEFRTKVDNLAKTIKDTVQPIINILTTTIKLLWEGILKPLWENVVKPLGEFLLNIFVGVLSDIVGFAQMLLDFIKPLTPILEKIATIYLQWLIGKAQILIEKIGEIIDKLKDAYEKYIKPIYNYLKDTLIPFVEEKLEPIKTALGEINDWLNKISGKKTIEIEAKTSGFKDSLKKIARTLGSSAMSVIFPNVSGIYNKIMALANGGMPPTGQLFIANEAGPELVGQIGNRTAVANNDQIVSAIRAGVYDAVSSAMNNGGFGTVDIQLHTDEGVVVDRINKITRQTGTCPINI